LDDMGVSKLSANVF